MEAIAAAIGIVFVLVLILMLFGAVTSVFSVFLDYVNGSPIKSLTGVGCVVLGALLGGILGTVIVLVGFVLMFLALVDS